MAVEAAVRAQLAATSAVTALVGSGSAARIYPRPLPQDVTLPALTYQRLGGNREHAMGSDPGNVESRIEVDSWATTAAGAAALAAAAHTALSRFSGTIGGDTIDASFAGVPIALYEPDRKIHRYMTDFMVWHRE